MGDQPFLVKVIHPYLPANNDELQLEKGEILTVARKEDGGWWEGTLSNGRTGWFPSNYVEEILGSALSSSSSATSPLSSLSPMDSPQHQGLGQAQDGNGGELSFLAQQAEYRQVAFNELLDSEVTHLQELQTFYEGFMLPLQKSEILSPGEYRTLAGNFVDVVTVHQNLIIVPLKAEQLKGVRDQRIGNVFLENAPKIEDVQKVYCANHPKAVQVVEKYKEQLTIFIETRGGRKPGILYLITMLSQPFRRLERYPALLQEIERHIEGFHKDRGDMQRSVEYYKELQKSCAALRKQKEMELEVLSGAIRHWEGTDVTQLGEIIFMNFVHLGPERLPRYLVLFNNTIVILSYNTESNYLVYEGKIPVSGITLNSLPDKEGCINAFEIAGPMIDPIIVSCSNKSTREAWLNHLNSILKQNRYPSFSASPQQSFGQLTPPVQAWTIDQLRPAPPYNPFLAEYFNVARKRQPEGVTAASASTPSLNTNLSKVSLQSSAGIRSQSVGGAGVPCTSSLMSFNGGSYNLLPPVVTNEEDFAILALVDSFCTTNRHNVSSSILPGKDSRNTSSQNVPVQSQASRTLAQIVLGLKDEVTGLKSRLEDEQKQRLALQQLVQKSLNNPNCGKHSGTDVNFNVS